MPFRNYNYAIPQVMPHAIPQTHSAFYPHRVVKRSEIQVYARSVGAKFRTSVPFTEIFKLTVFVI